MIKIIIHENNDLIEILGHAMYDDFGKDIVCAGVSSIVTTSINAILSFNNEYITYKSKKDIFTIEIKENDEIVDKLINNMINMLKEIEENYPKNINIRKEN